ncbi:MAG: hypothetical protein RL302_345 [Pseudomonadota bacterium]|jgi:peptidyl-prolyl cis-trans isomerase A (cyclophilin A)
MTQWNNVRRLCLMLCAGFVVHASATTPAAPKVKFQTSQGEFIVELYPDKAPVTVENFLQYVKDKHYDGTVFHRVMDNFMIQGGGFTANMAEKTTRAPITLESRNGLKNDRGTIAMARTSAPNSATAQFFVNVVDNNNLNAPQPDGNGYAVFGKVVQGMETVDKIRSVPTTNKGPFQNVPASPIVINSATLVK